MATRAEEKELAISTPVASPQRMKPGNELLEDREIGGEAAQMARVERVYRSVSSLSSPFSTDHGPGSLTFELFLVSDFYRSLSPSEFVSHSKPISILVLVLPMLRHQILRRSCADHEYPTASQPQARASPDLPPGLNRPRLVLRLLCHLRPARKFGHDKIESAGMDESDCDWGWHCRQLYGSDESRLEFLVTKPASIRLFGH